MTDKDRVAELEDVGRKLVDALRLEQYLEGPDSDYGEPALSERKAVQEFSKALSGSSGEMERLRGLEEAFICIVDRQGVQDLIAFFDEMAALRESARAAVEEKL